MLRNLALAGVAVATMALNAPVAHAAVVTAHCGYDSVSAGGTRVGVVYGYAVFSDQGSHTLRCYTTVDGVEQSSTPSSSGTLFVVVIGEVRDDAADGAVELCTEIDGVTVSCGDAAEAQIPPQEVIDLLRELETTLEPTICTVLKALAPGVPGVIDITPDGDTTLAVVGPFWDCPPYGNLFPPA